MPVSTLIPRVEPLLNVALVTLCADVFDTRAVGSASGMAGTCAWVGGMAFTFVIGKSADTYGYGPLFAALGGLDLLAALVLWGLLRRPGAGSRRVA